jgi:lactate 2-monooxygenase
MSFSALDWQRKIYLNGFAGTRPIVKIDFANLEESARKHMSEAAFAYIAGGAGNEQTMRSNREAFDKTRIIPRMLCDVGQRDIGITLLGQRLPSPLLLSPVGVLEMVHEEGDRAVARAAAELAIPYIFSNQASYSMESCAAVMGNNPRWFQSWWQVL